MMTSGEESVGFHGDDLLSLSEGHHKDETAFINQLRLGFLRIHRREREPSSGAELSFPAGTAFREDFPVPDVLARTESD